MAADLCACCGVPLAWQGDYARCSSCGLWQSRLPAQILDETAWQQLDETARGEALRTLRQNNFRILLQRLNAVRGKAQGALLDIGCAHGWFVEQARDAGYESTGLEPDPRLAAYARKSGATIREGFFPQALTAHEQFDVLVFNDVFEHIPAPREVLDACARHLRNDGLLVLNLPLATGFFYRLSRVLRTTGIAGPWLRMWQVGFPSPHLFFFESKHLVRLAGESGFSLVSESALPSVSTHGLWARLRMDNTQPLWVHLLLWPALMLMSPILGMLPNDIGLLIFRKQK